MRYIIVGAGSVGCTIGACLASAGLDVVLVARGEHLRTLRAKGLRLTTPTTESHQWIQSVAGPQDLTLDPEDRLLLTTKSQDSTQLLEQWASRPVQGGGLAGDILPVFCVQNGVENERTALRHFSRVYGVCAWLLASVTAPGHVDVAASQTFGVFDLGRYPRGTDEVSATTVADLREGGFFAFEHQQAAPWKYGKLLCNLGNAVQAACGRTHSEPVATLCKLARDEALACYRAAGIAHIDLPSTMAARGTTIEGVQGAWATRLGSSTWQSLIRNSGTTEVDYLNGEISLLGRLYDVPTPTNDLLRQVVDELARSCRAPGSLDAVHLLRRLEGSVGARLDLHTQPALTA
ncbi:ketopantoate reductase family protein [Streptomyces sp. NPDC048566]|uniref:ketopantoate reductase family protein n=1 Tax=unclassified Streptomyces TaxID=2593676 RepID=UPI0033F604D4